MCKTRPKGKRKRRKLVEGKNSRGQESNSKGKRIKKRRLYLSEDEWQRRNQRQKVKLRLYKRSPQLTINDKKNKQKT